MGKGSFNLGFQNLKVFGTRLGNIRKRHKFHIFYCNKAPNVKKSIELIIRKSFFDHIMYAKYTRSHVLVLKIYVYVLRIYSKGQEGWREWKANKMTSYCMNERKFITYNGLFASSETFGIKLVNVGMTNYSYIWTIKKCQHQQSNQNDF